MEPTRSVDGQARLGSLTAVPILPIHVDALVFVVAQVSRGLWKKYGDKRIIDTPISEVRTC